MAYADHGNGSNESRNELASNQARLQNLEKPERIRQLPPERLLDLLALKETDTVLDLGAGGGYFTFPAARRTENKVYAVDNDSFMLDILQERSRIYETPQVEILTGNLEHIPLASSSVDAAIASLILHILEDPAAGIKEIRRVMKPGAKGLVVEWLHPRPDGKPGHRIPLTEMERLLQPSTVLSVRQWADTYYSIVFQK